MNMNTLLRNLKEKSKKKNKRLSDKTIRYSSLRKELARILTTKASTDKKQPKALVFLNQGLDTKEFTELTSLFLNFGINTKKIPHSTWSNSIIVKKSNTQKTKAKESFFGDLIMLYQSPNNQDLNMYALYKNLINMSINKLYENRNKKSLLTATKNVDKIYKDWSNENFLSQENTLGKQRAEAEQTHSNLDTKLILPWEIFGLKPVNTKTWNQKNKNEQKEKSMKILLEKIANNNVVYLGGIVLKNDSVLHLEQYNMELYLDYCVSNGKTYDLLLNQSVSALESFTLKIDPLNKKYLGML